jgi:hypothetical protein
MRFSMVWFIMSSLIVCAYAHSRYVKDESARKYACICEPMQSEVRSSIHVQIYAYTHKYLQQLEVRMDSISNKITFFQF